MLLDSKFDPMLQKAEKSLYFDVQHALSYVDSLSTISKKSDVTPQNMWLSTRSDIYMEETLTFRLNCRV